MAKQFDVIVLGTGTAGAGVAMACRRAGKRVAIVDDRPYGGTCALRGCDPKKVLLAAAEAVDAARRLRGKGVAGDVRVDWPELMRFKRTFTDPVPEAREKRFAEAGIGTYHGTARFVGERALEVDGVRLEAERFHVATGAKPADLPIAGAEHLTTSDAFLDLDALPARIVFLGSGYIAFELAHLAAIAGARVTMVEMQDRPLGPFDPDLVDLLVERTRGLGIDLHLATKVEAVEPRDGEGLRVRATHDDAPVSFDADMVVHSAGRVPNVADLDLDAAGVEFDKRGIAVNAYLQSVSNEAVYAAGDVARGGLPLTPVAGFEADVVTANLLEGNRRRIDYPPIPSVVFTEPPLAMVGLKEDEARAQGLEFDTHHARTSDWYSSRRLAEPVSGHKVLVEKGSGRILGAHLLGPRAEELVNLFTLAMRGGLAAGDLVGSIFAYPTRGSDVSHMV